MNRLTPAVCFFAAAALLAQDVRSSTLQGLVRDSHDRIMAGATVDLKTAGHTSSVKTDADGRYLFPDLQPGTYTLHTAGALDVGPFVLGPHESRSIDLAPPPAGMPQYSDTPSFIVAGVTGAANRGGHGGDPILHSTEALSKATASLGATAQQGDALAVIRADQQAAENDPSEPHLFDWGAELLIHRAAEQAAEIFSRGNRLFPHSTRMLLGLAVSWYSRGSFDHAERFFFEAADLNPADPTPYLFLGQARHSPVGESDGYSERMERFARLQPANAWANYYYAANLRLTAPAKAQALLEKAVRIDPSLGAAWLQLGILRADQNNFSQAISAWQRATTADPSVIEAHYRLAQAYRRIGDAAKAKAEIETFGRLSKESAQTEERERSAIREFVFTLRDHH
jgi:tetratricopeptide (TPR) repeat protein